MPWLYASYLNSLMMLPHTFYYSMIPPLFCLIFNDEVLLFDTMLLFLFICMEHIVVKELVDTRNPSV